LLEAVGVSLTAMLYAYFSDWQRWLPLAGLRRFLARGLEVGE
jgi:hypothetical protein